MSECVQPSAVVALSAGFFCVGTLWGVVAMLFFRLLRLKGANRRFHPRIDGIPVNVEAQIWKLCSAFNRDFSVDDIVQAWGKLRGEKKRKKGSAAADVRAIILAEDRRRKRAEKRLAHV